VQQSCENTELGVNVLVVVLGFEGKKCEKLSSVSLRESDAYVSLPPLSHRPHSNVTLPPLSHRPHSNVTLLLSTRHKQGVILYHGVDEHLAVELFLGRLRVSYNIGNYPVSTMFSYEQLSDGNVTLSDYSDNHSALVIYLNKCIVLLVRDVKSDVRH